MELDLLTDMIERFRELRRPGRMIKAMVQEKEIYQIKKVEALLHPMVIEGITELCPRRSAFCPARRRRELPRRSSVARRHRMPA